MKALDKFFDPGRIVNATRVSITLPVKTPDEIDAFQKVLDHIKELIKDRSSLIKGYTASNYPDSVFWGKWVANKNYITQGGKRIRKGEIVTDRHAIIHFDIDNVQTEEEKFRECFAKLHHEVAKIYIQNKSGQFAFWFASNKQFRLWYPSYETQFEEMSRSFVLAKDEQGKMK